MLALDRANEVRLRQVDVKREIAAGTLSLVDALVDPRAKGMRIGDVLEAQRGYGPHKVRRALEVAARVVWGPMARPMMETRPVKSLNPIGRRAIIQACGGGR
jgi:hypothetical protein